MTIPGGREYSLVKKTVEKKSLHTVCLEAGCPNIGECLSRGTAAFLIMGDICARNCLYCSVKNGSPLLADYAEPGRVADAVSELKLSHAVITSVARDDLPYGGADIFSKTVSAIRQSSPDASIEILTPDFKNSMNESVSILSQNPPDIFNHNIEVAKSHYQKLRPAGSYDGSLELIGRMASSGFPVKTGIMAGFGESIEDIFETIDDLKSAGCVILTAGQYLKSRRGGYPVQKYYSLEEFNLIRDYALNLGFIAASCAPMVRSSYRAAELIVTLNNK